ncbi:hypothetical protein Hamer_G002544 [Homarus americanus]|uniref:Integrase p58-like C-terminal domain-containing protein n=1 Tax=Homarus americanus TaxID=6706 RepID=A0A8J5K2R0_HOMAM|nr:hypothetical protein Hamer_G002544 [Homarus americanus]
MSYVKSLQERLTEVQHQVRGALEFSGEVMKRNHDVKASQVCYKDGDMVWLYNPLRKKGQSPKLQSPQEGSYTVVECLSDVTYRIRGRGKPQPKVVHVNHLWQYHGPHWARAVHLEDSEEQSPTTDEDHTGDPGRTQGRTDPGNPTMVQEEEHCSLLAELDVTRDGDRSEDVTEVAAPRTLKRSHWCLVRAASALGDTMSKEAACIAIILALETETSKKKEKQIMDEGMAQKKTQVL